MNQNLKINLCKKVCCVWILWQYLLFLFFMRTEKVSRPNCERNEAVSSRGNTARNLNTANIPAAGGYSALSLHGAPLLCLTFEDNERDIKERWAKKKNSPLAWHGTVIFSRTKRMMAIGTSKFVIIYWLMVITKALTIDKSARVPAGRPFNGAEKERKSRDLSQ